MPPKTPKKEKTPIPSPLPSPLPPITATSESSEQEIFFINLNNIIREWRTQYHPEQEYTVSVLKDAKYFEKIENEILIEDKVQEEEFRLPKPETPVVVAEYSKIFPESFLQAFSLTDDINALQKKRIVDIGIGFNKEGVFYKIMIEEAELVVEFTKLIAAVQMCFTTITTLQLIDCNLTASHITTLSEFLKSSKSVTDVKLDLNPVPQQNFYLLIKSTGVEHLSLRHCRIDCFGAKMIAKVLAYQDGEIPKLKSLCLNGNAIHDEGLVSLVLSLRTNITLLFLSLAKNIISDYGVIELANILKKFPLTQTEDFDRRFSYLKYLEKIEDQVLLQIDLNEPVVTNSSTGNVQKKSNTFQKRMSKKKSKQNSRSNKTNGSTSALNLKGNFSHYPSLTDVHSYKLHPLLAMTCDDEKKYCTGNFSLQFINLSYNWFSKLGLDALFEAVTYQAAVGPQETGPGLMCIHLEGLYMIKDSLEVNKLYNILDNRSIPSYLDCRDLTKFMKRHDDDNNIVLTE